MKITIPTKLESLVMSIFSKNNLTVDEKNILIQIDKDEEIILIKEDINYEISVHKDKITYVYSDKDRVYCYANGEYFRSKIKLYEFEKLRSNGFVRVNKQEVVNFNFVSNIKHIGESKLKLCIIDNIELLVSRHYKKNVIQYLKEGL